MRLRCSDPGSPEIGDYGALWLVDGQIPARDNPPVVSLADLGQQAFFRLSPEKLMVEDEQSEPGPVGDLGEFVGRRVEARVVPLPHWSACGEGCLRIDLVDEDITAVALLDDTLTRSCISGDDNGFVGRNELVSECVGSRSVLDSESDHGGVVPR